MTHSVWRGKETLRVWIPPPGTGGVSRVQQPMRLQRVFFPYPQRQEGGSNRFPSRPSDTHTFWGECPPLATSPEGLATPAVRRGPAGEETAGLTVGVTEETLHGMQVLAAQPCLVGLRGDGHQLGGGVFEQQVLLAVGLRAEHLEAAALMAEQALCVKGSGCGLVRSCRGESFPPSSATISFFLGSQARRPL